MVVCPESQQGSKTLGLYSNRSSMVGCMHVPSESLPPIWISLHGRICRIEGRQKVPSLSSTWKEVGWFPLTLRMGQRVARAQAISSTQQKHWHHPAKWTYSYACWLDATCDSSDLHHQFLSKKVALLTWASRQTNTFVFVALPPAKIGAIWRRGAGSWTSSVHLVVPLPYDSVASCRSSSLRFWSSACFLASRSSSVWA